MQWQIPKLSIFIFQTSSLGTAVCPFPLLEVSESLSGEVPFHCNVCVTHHVSVDCSVLALRAVVGMEKKFGLLKCLANG